jgi:hypothetical protein
VNPPGDIVTYEPSEDDLGRKCAFSQAENVENGCEVSLSNPGETPSESTGCPNDQEPEHRQRPSSWLVVISFSRSWRLIYVFSSNGL